MRCIYFSHKVDNGLLCNVNEQRKKKQLTRYVLSQMALECFVFVGHNVYANWVLSSTMSHHEKAFQISTTASS